MTKRKKQILNIISRVIIMVSFIAISAFLIIYASGYQINFKARIVEKTGIIVVKSDPSAELHVNNKSRGKTPSRLMFLPKGIYHLRLQTPQYKNWEKTIVLNSEEYIKIDTVLFLDQPKIQEFGVNDNVSSFQEFGQKFSEMDSKEQAEISLPPDAKDVLINRADKEIIYRTEYEIWTQSFLTSNANNEDDRKIISRQQNPISKIFYYPDFEHILYVCDNKLYVVELSGINNTFLVNVDDPNVKITANGKKILINQKGISFVVTVR